MANKILFLTLRVFSATGGIEKLCRIIGKALYENSLNNNDSFQVMSMHGPHQAAINNKYFPAEFFTGYDGAKFTFVKNAVAEGKKCNTVILSHINLLVVAWLIKKISPNTKIILLAHGIEIWGKLPAHKLKMLHCCDKIVSVSSFTKNKIINKHNIPSEKCFVLNNCIDPFLLKPNKNLKSDLFLNKYNISNNDTVLLTLTRLSFRDRYKGYNYVLKSLSELVVKNKSLKYILAGGYEASEKIYIDDLIQQYNLQQNVILTGYIDEEDLPDLFSVADIFVMPSIKEGFGIVFVEAMYYGIPVIAANADGSTDALLNGELGILVNPESPIAITQAVDNMINNYNNYLPNQKKLVEHFSYETYKRNFEKLLN